MNTIEKALAKQKAKQAELEAQQANKDEVVAKTTDVEPVSENTTESTPVVNKKTKKAAIKVTEMNHELDNDRLDLHLELDKKHLSSRGYLIDTGTRKIIKEEFRQIKRKILNNAFGSVAKTLKNSNLIMVTSSKPNEGKTFVSINLALSIALEQDKTVLLVDADVLRPSVIRELGLTPQAGLIEYLLGDVDSIRDVMYSTNIDKLKIIPSGEPHHLSNELLASERMAELAAELAKRYPDRVVIFDSPPLLGVTETPVLASLMGQGIIVVEESKSQIADIQKATQQLDENMALGLVINKAVRSHKDLYGYYGYGYGYDSQS